ncbi:restriction endonuclease subunit S [Desulfurispora thermophila]|uniref:restriction endonuclease subunit S n=1 Tax=Desulfurispora thermophila TaxID=265470 RepID=UPI000375178E|nr:restriction endonuclease subunit S [Desulfurispora thermophila]
MNRNLSWINTKLGDVLDQILGGGTPSKSVVEYWDNGNIPWATVKDMAEGKYVLYDTKDHITEAGVKNSATRIIPKGTVIISTRMGLGRCFINKVDMAINQDLKALIPKKDLVDTKFLLWLYASKAQTIDNLGTGTTVKGIRIEQVKDIDISLPPLPTQRKIAAILSAYDDLIENNTRRIKILEEMAQLIYREWFVKFRFPGHEKVRMVDSELGPIPEGWEVKPIGEVFDTLGGGTPSTKNPQYWENGTITWFTPSDLTSARTMFISDSARKITLKGLENSSAKMFPSYCVMMTSRATIGVTAINTVPACTNQGFIVCIPNEIASTYQIYYWILTNRERIEAIASGATYKEINRTEFRSFSYVIADLATRKRFESLIEPLAKQIENLTKKNSILRRTRDLLLPKLISGELDVEDLDIPVGGD